MSAGDKVMSVSKQGMKGSIQRIFHVFFALGEKFTQAIKVKKLICIAIFLQLSIGSLLLAQPVDFADPNLKEAVEAELGIDDPNQTDMLGLTYLSANSSEIRFLTGLEHATELNELHLSGNLISDISPISTLTRLIYLFLNDNLITDISAVSSLANLDTLFLSINLINDISPLSDPNLTGLTSLYLGSNQIINISSLSGLSNLTILDLTGDPNLTSNLVVDISAVSNLTSLEELYLTNNRVVDIPDMSNLTSLEHLYLTNNLVVDISEMSNLTSLQYLHLDNNLIEDILGLTGEEPNDLISLLLYQNPLGEDAYCIDLPIIIGKNPLLETLTYNPNPYDCFPDTCFNAVDITSSIVSTNTYGDSKSTSGAVRTEESICSTDDVYAAWHSYTPESTEVVVISLCRTSGGQALSDSTLAVYDACGGTLLACNDDYCSPHATVTLELTGGEDYLIRVSGYSEAVGTYTLDIGRDVVPTPPVNNDCQDAIEILYYDRVTDSTALAYGSDITSCTTSDIRSVWYKFIPPISALYLIDPNGSEYNTSLAVFDACGGEPNELACNNDYCDYTYETPPNPPQPLDTTARIVVSLKEGATYYIRLSGLSGRGGTYSLAVTLAADINGDGVVDIYDLIWLVDEWLPEEERAPRASRYADIGPEEADGGEDGGGDKFIDLVDFAVLGQQFGADPL